MKGVKLYFHDGSRDWIDPVNMDEIVYTETEIVIHNGFNEYRFEKSKVKSLEEYDTADD